MRMKRMNRKISVCILLILTLLCAVSSCTPRFEYKDGAYVDKKNDNAYVAAIGNLEPAAIGEEYAKIGSNMLNRIDGLDPAEFLCERTTRAVFCNKEIKIPSFEELTVEKILLCYEDAVVIEFKTLTEQADIDYIRDAYLNGTPGMGFASVSEIKDRMSIKFVVKELPGLYFSILYTTGEDGRAYITDRYNSDRTRVSIVADGLLDRYIKSTDTGSEGETE